MYENKNYTVSRSYQDYFAWLVDKIGGGMLGRESYWLLLNHLHRMDYIWREPMDENRAIDGISLRRAYLDECRITDISFEDEPCSVLELFVALAIRCEDTMHTIFGPDETWKWFWRWMEGLGLDHCEDWNFDRRYVDEKIGEFLDQKVWPNGEKRSNSELWVWLNEWMNEQES